MRRTALATALVVLALAAHAGPSWEIGATKAPDSPTTEPPPGTETPGPSRPSRPSRVPPTAEAGGPYRAEAGGSVALAGSCDPSGAKAKWSFVGECGNARFSKKKRASTTLRNVPENGCTVRLTCRNRRGKSSDEALVSVAPPPSGGTAAASCSNGVDDDADGAADHPADAGCAGPQDRDEGEAWSIALDFEQGAEGAIAYGPDGFRGSSDFIDHSAGTVFSRRRAYSGGQSAEARTRAGENSGFGGSISLPERLFAGDEIWMRVRVYWPSGFDFAADPWLKFLRLRTASPRGHEGFVDAYLFTWNNPNPSEWVMISEVGTQPAELCGADASHNPVYDQWETYEMYVRLDARAADQGGAGRVRFWRNGELVCDAPWDRTLRAADSFAHGFFFSTYWNDRDGGPAFPSRSQSAWVDAITITNATPGRVDAHGNPYQGMAECDDGVDNDGDGRIDFPADGDCRAYGDDEAPR